MKYPILAVTLCSAVCLLQAEIPLKTGEKNHLTYDGVHMAAAGNRMMAATLLEAFGIDDTELAKARDAWLDIPNTSNLKAEMHLTQRQMQQIEKLAASRKTSVDDLISGEFSKLVKSFLETENH